jgi:PiT family inorganic phosphate transporter
MDIQFILLIIGLILAFLLAVNIGGNDAANPTSAAVGSGVLSIRRALLMFALFTVAGSALQGFMVMKTIGQGIVPSIDVVGAIAIVLAANIWILFATIRGMAISTGHSIIAAVVGYGIMQYAITGLNYTVLGSIVLSWIISPLCAIVVAILIYRGIGSYIKKYHGNPETLTKFFRWLLIGFLCFAAYSFGANDVSHATGVYITIASQVGKITDQMAMFLLAVFGAVGLVVGGLIFGPKVIQTLAFQVTHLDLNTALSATMSNAIVVYIFATVPYLIWGYGIPISSSYVAVGAIIGAGMARSVSSVSKAVSLKLISYWIITVPANILLAMGIYYLLKLFF